MLKLRVSILSWFRAKLRHFLKLASLRVRLTIIAVLSAFTSALGALVYSQATGQPYTTSLYHVYSVLYGEVQLCMESRSLHGEKWESSMLRPGIWPGPPCDNLFLFISAAVPGADVTREPTVIATIIIQGIFLVRQSCHYELSLTHLPEPVVNLHSGNHMGPTFETLCLGPTQRCDSLPKTIL